MYSVGEGLYGWMVFWLILGLGLPVEVGVVTFFVDDYSWSEVAVAEVVASVSDDLIYWIGLTGGVATGVVAATGRYFAMAVSEVALKMFLIPDSMCGVIKEISHG